MNKASLCVAHIHVLEGPGGPGTAHRPVKVVSQQGQGFAWASVRCQGCTYIHTYVGSD